MKFVDPEKKPNKKERKQSIRTKWTPEEDQYLLELNKNYSNSWQIIAQELNSKFHKAPVRKNNQCRARFLIIKQKQQQWSKDQLKTLIIKHFEGYSWSQIAEEFPGRSEEIVKKQYSFLKTYNQSFKNKILRQYTSLQKQIECSESNEDCQKSNKYNQIKTIEQQLTQEIIQNVQKDYNLLPKLPSFQSVVYRNTLSHDTLFYH